MPPPALRPCWCAAALPSALLPPPLPLTVTAAMPAVAALTAPAASEALEAGSNGVPFAADTEAANK